MHSQLTYNDRLSIRMTISLFFADVLNNIDKRLSEKIIKSLIRSFDKLTDFHLNMIEDSNTFSIPYADKWLKTINSSIIDVEKFELPINKFHSKDLTNSFKSYKRSLYRFEAILHKISTSENAIIETPEVLKDNISNLGVNSIKHNIQ